MTNQATAPKLYELTDAYTNLANQHYAILEDVEEAEGVISEEQEALLGQIKDELDKIIDVADAKILNIARLCLQRSLEIAAIKGEEDRITEIGKGLSARRKRLERSNEFFENYVLQAMRMMDVRELSDGLNKARISESKSTEVVEPGRVPPEYIRQVTVKMPESDERGAEFRGKVVLLLTENHIAFDREVDKVQAKKDIDKEGKEDPDTRIKTSDKVPGVAVKVNQKVRFS
ncbi:siphovirus Gp157 family protein [bacterium]|nr:siphovirus Gp157 family protein [bacterium]